MCHMQGPRGSAGLQGTDGDDGARGQPGYLGFPGPLGINVSVLEGHTCSQTDETDFSAESVPFCVQ